MNTFLSSVAVLLSTLALMCSGYAAYQVFTLQQTIDIAKASNSNTIAANPTTPPETTNATPPSETPTASPTTSPSPSPTATEESTAVAIQPGQFVQPAFGRKAEVELLAVKRIKDPDTANRDVINVQMRIRRLTEDEIDASQALGISQTTARNPDTSETYRGVGEKRSTGVVSLSSLSPKASADAYVWLRVPNGVDKIDIFVPNTAAFSGVPITD